MTTSTGSEALIPSPTRSTTSHQQEQELGGNVYQIDPSEIEKRRPKWKTALVTTGMVLASPVLIPAAAVYVLSMYMGPIWWKNKAVQALITATMGQVAELMDAHRQELLQHILPSHKVLDLGAGAGHYMKYLSQAGTLVAVEPNPNFHANYKQKAIDAGVQESRIHIYDLVLEEYIAQNPKELDTFDWVILGNVLCEVEDQVSTLHCVNQLLKRGGHIYFSEHIASPLGTWKRSFQNIINPVWQVAGGGCNCNRDSLVNIRQIPGWQTIFWQYDRFRVALGPFVLGLALKQ